jgi:hypothetical protein
MPQLAQTDFRPGYVLKNSGDTLFGEIDYRGAAYLAKKCRYREHPGDSIRVFTPDEIKAFRFIDSKYYVSRKIKDGMFFLEYLIKGEIDLFYIRDDDWDHFYIKKEDMPLVELPYKEEIVRKGHRTYLDPSKKHIGILNYYMQDAPNFYRRIHQVEKPKHENLIKLAKDYHDEVCKDEECIIYDEKVPWIKIALEPVGGFIKYNEIDDFKKELGLLIYVWQPRVSEKIYLKGGFIYNPLENIFYRTEKINLIKLPIQVQYMYPSSRLKPRVGFGFNFFSFTMPEIDMQGVAPIFLPVYDHTHTIALNGGINYNLYRFVDLSLNINTEFTPLLSEKDTGFEMVSYSVILGLYFEIFKE